MLRIISRIECKQESALDTLRHMDEKLRTMMYKITVISAVISMAVGYLVRDLEFITHLFGGL